MAGMLAGTIFDRPPHCERCDLPENRCECPPPETAKLSRVPPQKQTARLSVEKRKRGKIVTVIRGLASDHNNLQELLTRLKNACGAGGTIQPDSVELQGKHIDRLRSELQKIGYRVKG
jgi:translation initiation factor 1